MTGPISQNSSIPALFADESVSGEIVRFLKSSGLDVIDSRSDVGFGAKDPVVLEASNTRQRILLTEDYDFSDMVIRDRDRALGLVIIALDRIPSGNRGAIVVKALRTHADALIGSLLTIEPARTRLRKIDAI